MDMYVRMFDELNASRIHNPTIGIILCAGTDKDIAKYSILNGNKRLIAAKYLTYLPSEEILKQVIEQQKEIFYLQHGKTNNENTEQ